MRPGPIWRPWAVALLLLASASAARAETMRASFYGAESGSHNADGSRFNPMGFTAASRSLAFGTRLEACLTRCAIVTVRDRGPFVGGRSLDLSRGAARAIGLEAAGVANISVRVIGRGEAGHIRRPRRSHHHHR